MYMYINSHSLHYNIASITDLEIFDQQWMVEDLKEAEAKEQVHGVVAWCC